MNSPRINNDERGLTINKTLGWTIAVGLVTGGLWIGSQVASLNSAIQTMTLRQTEDRQAISVNRQAISDVRLNEARVDARLSGIEASQRRTEATITEILRYLRGDVPIQHQ